MIKVKVVGCGGYGGVGIVELLLRHPEAKIQTLVAATETGMPMSELYPHLKGFCDLPILKPDDPAAQERLVGQPKRALGRAHAHRRSLEAYAVFELEPRSVPERAQSISSQQEDRRSLDAHRVGAELEAALADP